MEFYESIVTDGYEWLNFVNGEDYEVITSFDGTKKSDDWKPLLVRIVRADNFQEKKRSDFPWLASDALVFRASALNALSDLLSANGELLPLDLEGGGRLEVLNAQVIDAIDLDLSDCIMFPGTKKIMAMRKPAFDAKKLLGIDVFRLPYRASSTYVSSQFVEIALGAGLVGLDFKRVW